MAGLCGCNPEPFAGTRVNACGPAGTWKTKLSFPSITALVLAHAPLTPGHVYDLKKPGRFDYMTVDVKYHRVFASHPEASTLAASDYKTGKSQEIDTGGEVNGVLSLR